MMFKRSVIIGLVGAMAVGGMAIAASHGGGDVEGAIKARKAHMGLNAFNLGILGKMAKGEMEFNADIAQAAANDLLGLASLSQASYWPMGSSNADVEGTRALPAGWENESAIMATVTDLHAAATAMAANAGTLEGVQASIGAVGGACGACHKISRAPES